MLHSHGRVPLLILLGFGLALESSGCRSGESKGDTLVLAAYTTPREVYGTSVLPKMAEHWKQKTGRSLEFQESYQGSGAQSRAVIDGFEADVVALSLAPDVDRLVSANLVDESWDDGKYGGMVTRSVVAIAVRPGNPKGIHDWQDLAREGIEVLTPNVRTSGGAMWNVAAIYGAALRGHTGTPAGDEAAAEALLGKILANVRVMDKGARESIVNFENGIGDAAITYENEVIVSQREGKPIEYVVPASTILIENPIAVVKTYAEKHGSTEVAEAFVQYLYEPAVQTAFAEFGYRPVIDDVTTRTFPETKDIFTVKDLGGWAELQTKVFAADAAYDRSLKSRGQ